MKIISQIRFLVIIFCLIWSNQIFAQPGRGLNRGNMTRLYDKSTIDTITGKITKIDTVKAGFGRFPGVLLNLQNKTRETKVYISPVWYLNDQKLQFSIGESLTITGSRIIYQDNPLIIAKEFRYKKKKIIIRDNNGIPVWAGKRMGPGRGRGRGRQWQR